MPCFSVVYGAQHYFGQNDSTFTAIRVFISSDDRADKWMVTVKMISYSFASDEV